MENQGRTRTPEEGRTGLVSSVEYEIKLYRQTTSIFHCLATIKAEEMCPRKDIRRAVGYVSLKPTVIAADLSGSAQGVAHPFPCPTYWQRHEWHPSRIWDEHKGLCLTYIG